MSRCQYIQSLYPSPVGILRIITSQEGLVGILWDNEDGSRIKLPKMLACSGSNYYTIMTQYWLDRYFCKIPPEVQSQKITTSSNNNDQVILNRGEFIPLLPPLLLSQFTSLEKMVILGLQEIPFSTTISYKEMANRIGNPTAVRAVASAIGKNPFSIILPCHRVLRSDGTLGGYAGGLRNKEFLLEYEKKGVS